MLSVADERDVWKAAALALCTQCALRGREDCDCVIADAKRKTKAKPDRKH